jgi:alpha-beta hydrolase superfamily lysophospholipase
VGADTLNVDWQPDVLGAGFEAAPLALRPAAGRDLVATLVRHRSDEPASPRAVLYVHGYNDYFFQRDLATWYAARGIDFYAVDLRRYGRSLQPDQTPNYCRDLGEYDEDLDAAVEVILASGHERLVVSGHSTGGLIVSLWAARRPGLPLDGLVLNSPFFEFKQPAVVRAVIGRAASVVSRRQPLRTLPGGVDTLYGDSIHAAHRGEWDYDLRWKPSPGFPVRLGWLNAIIDGHRALHAGLDLRMPVLVMSSTRTVTAHEWTEDLRRGDAVLDADSIARWAPAVGRHVTIVRIDDGLHDLVLSAGPARDATYETMATWLAAWVV